MKSEPHIGRGLGGDCTRLQRSVLHAAFLGLASLALLEAGCGKEAPLPGDSPPNPSVRPEVGAAVVQGDLGGRADRFLRGAQQDSGFAGAVVIAERGVILLRKGYGWVDAQQRVPITADTPFWIASISKQFTACAILELVEEGKLALEDTIGAYFRSVPEPRRATTIHQLLTHTACLEQNYLADGIADRDSAVQVVLLQPLAGRLGTRFTYSNDAYSVLAALIEVVSGVSFEGYLRSKLLEPAGLQHTGFWGPPDHPDVVPVRRRLPESISRPNWGYRGGVGMYSSAADLHRWNQALAANQVLTAASRSKLQSPFVARGAAQVGYGWFISKTPRGTRSIWTRGYEDFGHGAVLATYPDEGIVIVVVSSSGDRGGDPVSHRVAAELAEIVFSGRSPAGDTAPRDAR